jgi:hypothetical protein
MDVLALKGKIQLMLILIFAILAMLSPSQTAAPSSEILRSTHDALFASFLPVDEVRQDADLLRRFSAARDGIWYAASQAPQFRRLLIPFSDLHTFGTACGVSDYLRTTRTSAFAGLTPPQRQHVLFLLQSCSENEPRRLAGISTS